MARNNRNNDDNTSKSWTNWRGNHIVAKTTSNPPRRYGSGDNALSMSVVVVQKVYGDEEPSANFLELQFFGAQADAIEANFGEDGPFSGGKVPIVITPGNMTITTFNGKLPEGEVVEVDGEEYEADKDNPIVGPRTKLVMINADVAISATTNFIESDSDIELSSAFFSNDDDDEEEEKPSRKKKSSSSRRKKREEEEPEEDDDDDYDDDDYDDEDEDDPEEDEDDDDGEEEEKPARKPRSRSERRGRSSRSGSSRRSSRRR